MIEREISHSSFCKFVDYLAHFFATLQIISLIFCVFLLTTLFDELQEFPEISTALKFFKLDGRFDVILSGSMLGINYNRIESKFDISDNAALSDDAIREQLEQLLSDKTAIQVISAWQKEMLLQTYPSLLQPYTQQVLKDYDDYDFVPVAVRKNFVLPVEENAIFVLSPDALRNYQLSVLQTETSLSITAAI